jgi:hypothetical protein
VALEATLDRVDRMAAVMSTSVTIPATVALLVLGSVWSSGGLLRASSELHARLPSLAEIGVPKPTPKPGEQVAATISLLQLRDARYRRGEPLEDWIVQLEGKFVAIEGYMALGTLEGLTRFELVPEECECGGSKVNHFVEVTMTEDVTRYKAGRFYMRGYFSASEVEEDGFVISVYRLRSRALPE